MSFLPKDFDRWEPNTEVVVWGQGDQHPESDGQHWLTLIVRQTRFAASAGMRGETWDYL